MIDVDAKKWKDFKRWCNNNETTMKLEMDKLLNKFVQEAKD